MAWWNDAKMLLVIPSKMNNHVNDQLALNLVYACLGNKLQVLCKSLTFFTNIWKIDYSKLFKFFF